MADVEQCPHCRIALADCEYHGPKARAQAALADSLREVTAPFAGEPNIPETRATRWASSRRGRSGRGALEWITGRDVRGEEQVTMTATCDHGQSPRNPRCVTSAGGDRETGKARQTCMLCGATRLFDVDWDAMPEPVVRYLTPWRPRLRLVSSDGATG